MVIFFVFFLSLKTLTIPANHSVSPFLFFFKFLFLYISTTCVGFGTVGFIGQTESGD